MNIQFMMQLLESTPQTGGYEECFHLEDLIISGALSSAAQVEHFVRCALQNAVGPLDGFAAGAIFEVSRRGDYASLPQVVDQLCNTQAPDNLRRASLSTGERIWEASRRWAWTESIHDQLDELTECTGHFHAVAFGALISDATVQRSRAIAACLLSVAHSLVLSAARYLPMEPAVSQHILNHIQPAISDLALSYSRPDAHAPPIRDPESIIAEFAS